VGRLTPVRLTCQPRDDVLSGRLTDIHFAAQLDKIVRAPGDYPVYGEPDRFFEISYPTAGLKTLIARVFGRLSGTGGEAGAYGVTRAETSFGGGKTHSLIAVHHLAKGARPANLSEFVDLALMPDGPVQVAGIVGDVLDPVNGLETNDHLSFTLWGEMAAQLGEHAFNVLSASDATRTAPGTETIRRALDKRPTVVIIDEIAQHLRQLAKSGSEDVRRSAGQIPVFLKNLFEVAMGEPNLAVVITLASSHDAYGQETDEISELLNEVAATYTQTLEETHSILERSGRPIKPAEDEEIGEILKRRLFSDIDHAAARAAGDAYRDLYEQIRTQGQPLGGGAAHPTTYGNLVASTYPFHPELVRVLDKRLGDIPGFNRARGALKLLAEVVAGIWTGDAAELDAEIINVADIDYAREEIRNLLTVGLNRHQFAQVAEVDIAGPKSHTAMVDSTRFAGRPPYATRACRTVFTHSLESKHGVGAGRSDYLLGTLRVDDDAAFLDEALAAAEKVCWHLDYDGTRWRFHTDPNVNRIIDEEKRNVLNSAAAEALEDAVRYAFRNDVSVQAIVFPTGPADVKDTEDLRVAVIHHDLLHVSAVAAQEPAPLLVDILDHVGVSGGIRKNRNTVVFVAADADSVDALRDRVKTRLAVEKLAGDHDRLNSYTEQIRSKIIDARDQAGVNERVAVTRCYKHVYFPFDDKTHHYLRHVVLPAQAQGDTQPATRMVLDVLGDEGKIRRDPFAYNWLRAKTWPAREATTTAEIAEWFYRDHSAPILRDPTYLKDAIREGIRGAGWVYYDTATGKAYTAGGASPNIEISRDIEVMTTDEANRRGLLVREPTLSDLYAVAVKPRQSGVEVRTALEARIGGEPTKRRVLDLLATAVGNERYGRIVVTDAEPTDGVTALTPTQIRHIGLDALIVLTRSEADRLGVAIPGRVVAIAPEKRGPAGMALQQLTDSIADLGKPVTALSVTGFAGEETGLEDVSLLVLALGQLPKQQISVQVELRAELPGLEGGFSLQVSGDRRDYQALNTKLSGLLSYATKTAGHLRLDISFSQEITVDTAEWQHTHTVLKNLGPKDVVVKATMGS
jgi:hypothetical protein